MKIKRRNTLAKILLIFISLFYLVPFYIVFNLAFKPHDFSSKWQFPQSLYLKNFTRIMFGSNMAAAFKNTFFILAAALILMIIFGAICSYPLARYKTKLNKAIYSIIISCLIVPGLMILVPVYTLMLELHGVSHYWSVIAVHVTFNMPLAVFLYTGFISMIPRELDDAAVIDGLSRFGVCFRIIMPLLVPVTITIMIICGVTIWNDYLYSLIFLQKSYMWTITLRVSMIGDISQKAAACIISTAPLIILFIFLQKYFAKGLASGALKL